VNTALKDLKRELEDARFSRAAFGYRSADVDNFMDELERKLDVAIAERDELVGLIEKLKNEILSLRGEKEAITRAIVNSEKIAQASVIDAGVKSKYILRDASEKAAKMMNSANDEYERKINEAKKLNEEIEAFVSDCIQKFGNQIESMKTFSRVPIKPLDMKNFQIDDIAKNFMSDDHYQTAQIFSDGTSISNSKN
jgi:cell division septum initiation protein DivIVA